MSANAFYLHLRSRLTFTIILKHKTLQCHLSGPFAESVWILVVQRETIHKQTHVHSPKNCLWSSWEHLLRGVCRVKPIHEKPFIRNKQLSCMYACETAGNSWEHRNSKIDITAKATCFHFMQMLYILLLSFDYDGFWRKKDMVTL